MQNPINIKNEIIRIGQIGIRFWLEAAETNGSLAIFKFTVPVGARVPLAHSHKHYDETIYGAAGVITLTVDGKVVDIGAGGGLFHSSRRGSWFQQPQTNGRESVSRGDSCADWP